MADPELVRVLDYILNRSDEASIEAVAAAVVRRRRDLSLFGSQKIPDPRKWAREFSSGVNAGIGMEGLKETVRSMAVRIIQREAPELTEEQIDQLTRAWIPQSQTGGGDEADARSAASPDLLSAMVDQFVSFSQGRMSKAEDSGLRAEMGAWPERYWKLFPPVIKLIINDYLKGDIKAEEFHTKIETALAM
jgi:hypothetical protein